MRAWLILLPALMLAACGEGEVARPARAAPAIPVPARVSDPSDTPLAPISPDGIRGQNARALIARFGQPRLDLQEGPARKLQFAGTACVMDVYLYARGRGEAVATHLDTRLRDGRPTDTGGCAATLRRQ
jgi:hypothetical protein